MTADHSNVTFILGPNASGKSRASTVSNSDDALSRLVLSDHPSLSLYSRITQGAAQIVHATHVRSFLDSSLVLTTRSPTAAAELIDRTLADLKLTYLLDRTMPTLSGGEDFLVTCLAAIFRTSTGVVFDSALDSVDVSRRGQLIAIITNWLEGRMLGGAVHNLILTTTNTIDLDAFSGLRPTRATRIVLSPGPRCEALHHFADWFCSLHVAEAARVTISAGTAVRRLDGETFPPREIRQGQVIAIAGDNGSGKSQFLCSLVGRSVIFRASTSRRNGAPLASSGFYIPQSLDHILSFENASSLRQRLEHRTGMRIPATCDVLFPDRALGDCSYGERRFALIALFLICFAFRSDKTWLLGDELDARLDVSAVAVLQRCLSHLAAAGRGVLLASHSELWVTRDSTIFLPGRPHG